MKQLEGLVCRLEACLQEELGSKERVLALMEAEERALRARQQDELERLARELEQELRAGASRALTRDRVLEQLAAALGVPRSATRLSSLVERLGTPLPRAAARLARLRAELRDRTAVLARATRRVAAAIALHRGLVRELLEALLGGGAHEAPLERPGTLIDAEA